MPSINDVMVHRSSSPYCTEKQAPLSVTRHAPVGTESTTENRALTEVAVSGTLRVVATVVVVAVVDVMVASGGAVMGAGVGAWVVAGVGAPVGGVVGAVVVLDGGEVGTAVGDIDSAQTVNALRDTDESENQ